MEQRNETMSMGHARGHSETCEEQLRRMCANIANSISEPQEITAKEEFGKLEKRTETASDWMEGTYDIRYYVDREKRYLGAEIMVAGGGPTIWVNTYTQQVVVFYFVNHASTSFTMMKLTMSGL